MDPTNKSLLIWKRWSQSFAKSKKEALSTMNISVIASSGKVALCKINSSEVDSSQTQDQEHLQEFCREEATWVHFMEMRRTCTLWDQNLVTLLQVTSKVR